MTAPKKQAPGRRKRPNTTAQEREFAKRYALGDEHGENRHNGAAAARGAGYKDGRGVYETARRLLRKAAIRRLVDELEAKREAKVDSKRDQVLAELHHLGLARIDRVLADDGSVKPRAEWPEDERAALTQLEVREVLGKPVTLDDGGVTIPVLARKVKVRMDSKLGALNTLAEVHGLVKSKGEALTFRLEDLIVAARRRAELEEREKGGGR